jgi:hypothetical protein
MMAEVLNSPMMDDFFGSPEKIEESRKAILENPMLKQVLYMSHNDTKAILC